TSAAPAVVRWRRGDARACPVNRFSGCTQRTRPSGSMLRTRIRAGPLAGFVLSALFAACFAVLGVGELFIPALSPEMGKPAPVTLRVPYGPRIVRDSHDG